MCKASFGVPPKFCQNLCHINIGGLYIAGWGMPEQCEQKAADCLRAARVMSDNTNKALLHQMALAWIERANQIRAKSEGERIFESTFRVDA
jgi:hypothetical protein